MSRKYIDTVQWKNTTYLVEFQWFTHLEYIFRLTDNVQH